MKMLSKMMMTAGALVTIGLVGCAGPSRDAMTKEYQRLAALPPVYCNHCASDKALDSLGVAVSLNYSFAHKTMKEYVAATENHRAYLGYMNEVDFLIQNEKLEPQAAMDRVAKAIQDEDAKITDAKQKKWPQVLIGIQATNALNPAQKLQEIAPVVVANAKAIEDCKKLKDSFKGFDPSIIEKGVCAGKIIKQGADTAECLAFISEQYRRVIKAKYFVK